MKMMAIRLLSTCIIAGLPRSPVEGIQTVPEDEAKRLIEANMAEDADADVDREDDDDGDGLDSEKVPALRKTAKDEGAAIESDANKAAILAAIRARRALFEDAGIDVQPDDGLRTIAKAEGVEVADDADTAALLAAITAKSEG